jgi:hypothetical protein
MVEHGFVLSWLLQSVVHVASGVLERFPTNSEMAFISRRIMKFLAEIGTA